MFGSTSSTLGMEIGCPFAVLGSKLLALAFTIRMLLKRTPDFDRWERERGHPMLKDAVLAQDSPTWRGSAERKQLVIQPPIGLADPATASISDPNSSPSAKVMQP